MDRHELYMQRCLQLARAGAGNVAPNPMVGAVLVHEDRVIAEGYHQVFGGPHAEVNCLNAVREDQRHLVGSSTLYVSLEPCSHFGKTPPCTDLILGHKIPRVVIGCTDPFEKVNGSGIQRLRVQGVEVLQSVLEKQALYLNRRFFCFHQKKRPYIILKWAQDAQRKMAASNSVRTKISNDISDRLVHKWRSEEAAIMVGTNTALMDDPSLTTRLWPGGNPTRVVLDKELKIPPTSRIFNGESPLIVFNERRQSINSGTTYCQLKSSEPLLPQVLHSLFKQNILSVIVEGGSRLLQSFIDEDAWDEARVITNTQLVVGEGLSAPTLHESLLIRSESYRSDRINYYQRANG